MKTYMAIDQYGQKEMGLIHPRKDLIARGYRGRVHTMYVDGKDGNTYKVGIVIGHNWFTLYTVEEMRIRV
jgi:hypothetical protein